MTFNRVKGTVDFYPSEKSVQNWIFDRFRAVARNYSFNEVEAPAMENLNLLTKKSGDEIRSQIFTLEKRSKEELGLRFEFTASLARMFIEKQKELAKPVKWFCLGRMWRYEQPQAGRLREFYQFDVEVFGSTNPMCDAEVINIAVDALKSVGLSMNDFTVFVNNRKLLQGLLSDFVKKSQMEDVLRIIDKRAKISPQEFERELGFLGENTNKVIKFLDMDFKDLKNLQLNELAQAGYNELEEIFEFLPSNAVFDLGTARGLAYYTGTVFEIFDSKKKYRALCGGGRYDEMIETFDGQPTPATGFGMGYSTVSLLLQDKKLLPSDSLGPDFFVGIMNGSEIEAMKIIRKLRVNNSVAYDINARNLGNQLRYANSLKCKKLIVIGPDEIKSGKCKVKNLESGKEVSKKISSL